VAIVRDLLRRDPPSDAPRPVPEYIRQLAWFLDDAIPIGSKWRIGADGLLSFIPGIGDVTGFALSSAVVLAGTKAGVSVPTLFRMILNATAETLAGLIPFAGPFIAMAWKSNKRNLRLIEADLADRHATRRSSLKVLVVGLVMVLIFLILLALALALLVWGVYSTIRGWISR